MKPLLCGIVFLFFAFTTYAEFEDATNGTVIYSPIVAVTRETGDKDLQEALGLHAYSFVIHRSILTNDFSMDVEIVTDGKTNVVSQTRDDYNLNIVKNASIGKEVPVFVSMNPVGSSDGESIYSAKKLHFFIKSPGGSTGAVVDNPFYQSKDHIFFYGQGAKESATVFRLLGSDSPKIEIIVRFHEW